MTTFSEARQAKALRLLSDELDIPDSYYGKAKARYESLGAWLEREGSAFVGLGPRIYAQGSFRYGTVKPAKRAFDLDLVAELTALSKEDQTQAWVKEAVGKEIKAYAEAHGMEADPKPTKRCWHVEYAEEGGLRFHMDFLPAVPEDEAVKALLAGHVPPELAQLAIAYTDKTSPAYQVISGEWPMSNPRGFARWFESRMRGAARKLLLARVEQLPPHRWNTPLQQVVRILKDHRDTMFEHDPGHKPVSVIITTLAGQAYDGQTDLQEAINVIVDRMPGLVIGRQVLNPTNPGENFADKWKDDPALEDAFWGWTDQLRRDVERLGHDLGRDGMKRLFEDRFGVGAAEDRFTPFVPAAPAIAVAHTRTQREPWGGRA